MFMLFLVKRPNLLLHSCIFYLSKDMKIDFKIQIIVLRRGTVERNRL